MTDLSTLLARVEAGSGADRELDREITALFYREERRHIGATCWDDATDTCCPGGKHLDLAWVDPKTDKWVLVSHDGFQFTTDLNAVIALVEARGAYEWSLVSARLLGRYFADVTAVNAVHGSSAPTAARALLAALLRYYVANTPTPGRASADAASRVIGSGDA